jgi:hypothetical protein
VLAALMAGAGACGDDGGSGRVSPEPTTAPGGSSRLTASFRGVTADTIKIGVPLVDFDAIKQFVDYTRSDQQRVYQTLIDAINARGGIHGRRIVAVYKTYSPIDPTAANGSLPLCTAFTEDEKVFAVLGIFVDFSGDAQLCVTRDHQTILVTHGLSQEWVDKSPPGLMVSSDITTERSVNVLMNLLAREKTLVGKTVAVLGDTTTRGRIDKVIEPELRKLGVTRAATAVLSISGADTSQPQAQLDGFIERWRSQKADALIITGDLSAAKQFVDKIREKLPRILLISDALSSVAGGATDELHAGRNPTAYEGTLVPEDLGAENGEQFQEPLARRCVATFRRANPGVPVADPKVRTPGRDGRVEQRFEAIRDACDELEVLRLVGERAGPNLTNETWRRAIDHYGEIRLPAYAYASFRAGKYDANDGFRLGAWDSSLGPNGGFKPLSPLENTAR